MAASPNKHELTKKAASSNKRSIFIGYFFSAIMLLLVLRLFQIQIMQGEEYANQALPQQTIAISTEKIQGNILDRNGIPFTKVGEILELFIFPKIIGFDETAYEIIYKLTGKLKSDFDDKEQSYFKEPVTSFDAELISSIEDNIYQGIILHKTNIRYDDTSLARHIIGYLRKSDGVPMSGIEKVYEQFLHPGSARLVQAITDAEDRIIPSLGYTIVEPDETGYDVQLALDYDIQRILENALDKYPERYHGGLVVDVLSGDILALASRPQYNQADPYNTGNNKGEVSFLSIPFQQFPLGSVFKLIIAAAALESGKYEEDTMFDCTGGIQVGSNFFPCHVATDGLGEITMREAFAYSCNDTFIKIAMEIGGDVILETARRFGLGKSVDIELDNALGTLMSKKNYTGPGIANLAIGQGETMVTPLQIADILTTILNQGQRKQLHLVKGLITSEGEMKENSKVDNLGTIISEKTAKALSLWMGDVTEYGTATQARDPLIGGTAGKTGTPQVFGDPHSNEYGWFAGFFPQENSRYVIVIMSREEGGASEVAVPVFHDVARGIWTYENELVNVSGD